MTASQNIILELKKLGIELDMSPNKLKSGFGDGVCIVLNSLTQISLQNKFKFKRPVIREDGKGFGDDDGDDMGDDFEGNADIADMEHGNKNGDDSDAIEDDMELGGNMIGAKNDEQEML
jgi:hypothetical protein